MQIEEGKSYKTSDGRKAGPMKRSTENNYAWHGPVSGEVHVDRIFQEDGTHGGTRRIPNNPLLDLIAEWEDEPTGPVTIETVKRINPGEYGAVSVKRYARDPDDHVRVSLFNQDEMYRALDASELRAAADVFIQLADALEGK